MNANGETFLRRFTQLTNCMKENGIIDTDARFHAQPTDENPKIFLIYLGNKNESLVLSYLKEEFDTDYVVKMEVFREKERRWFTVEFVSR